MTQGWSLFVIVLVIAHIAGYTWLLWWTGRRRPGDPAPDDTGHVWDENITEYNKPLPKWWVNGFYLSIVFGVAYLIWYPGLGAFPGVGNWTSASEHDQQRAANDALLEETFAVHAGQPIPVLARNDEALQLGRSIFANTCATCHGSTAQGAIGYPDLTDDHWQWGGEPEDILTTILDGRDGIMPPWGSVLVGMGGEQAMTQIVAYTRALAQPDAPRDFFATRGERLFEGLCVACHMADGTGNPSLGAPNLTRGKYVYGGSSDALHQTIAEGRHGVMPAHRDLLGETRARLVAAYVWSLSNPAEGTASTAVSGSGQQ